LFVQQIVLGRAVTTGGAAAKELQPVAFDLVASRARQVAEHVGGDTGIELLNAGAGDAYKVVVMVLAAADSIAKAAILQEDAAKDAYLRQKLDGAEDGGSPYPWHLAQDVVHAEVAATMEHRRHHR